MTALLFMHREMLRPEFPFKFIRHQGHSFRQPLHTHDYVQIAYVVRGVCSHHFNGRLLTASKGDMFVIPPSVEHRLETFEDKTFDLVLLDFLPLLLDERLKPLSQSLYERLTGEGGDAGQPAEGMQPWVHIPMNKQPLVEQLLQDIQDEFEHKEEGYQLSIRLNLAKLLLLLERERRKAARLPSGPAAARPHQRQFEEIVRFVHENYDQDISLEEGAGMAGMAPTYFSHSFKKETGLSFIELVHEVRIERAKELIRQQSRTMTDICYEVGFRHLSHFIRTFKKRTGLTPTAYRKMVCKIVK